MAAEAINSSADRAALVKCSCVILTLDVCIQHLFILQNFIEHPL